MALFQYLILLVYQRGIDYIDYIIQQPSPKTMPKSWTPMEENIILEAYWKILKSAVFWGIYGGAHKII